MNNAEADARCFPFSILPFLYRISILLHNPYFFLLQFTFSFKVSSLSSSRIRLAAVRILFGTGDQNEQLIIQMHVQGASVHGSGNPRIDRALPFLDAVGGESKEIGSYRKVM